MMIDLTSDSVLKQIILLPFVASYLCETGFPAGAVLKTMYRSRLVIKKKE